VLDRGREAWNCHRDQDADDRHDNQQLDEREAGLCVPVAHVLFQPLALSH
jgi:hypothetical protein